MNANPDDQRLKNDHGSRDRKLVIKALHDLVVDEATEEVADETLDFEFNAIGSHQSKTDIATGELEEPKATQAPTQEFGAYELLSVLGRGGMGVVFQARQKSLDRLVALKMIRSGMFADERETLRFQNEVEAVAALDHPNILPVLEFGQVGRQKYYTMKLVRGGALDSRIEDYFQDPTAAAQVMLPIVQAVHHAHQRGILHRDLKPANVLLDEETLVPYVTDFGLARRMDTKAGLTATGEALGTPSYMAPEQAAGKNSEIGVATDVYGLGAILYALLTKQAPFKGESVLHTLELVRTASPQSPRKLNPRIPRDLEVLCLKCLQHEPEQRYESANAVAEDLDNFLQGRPLKARPLNNTQRLWLWARRNRLIATLATSAIALLLGITAISSWSAVTLSHRNQQIQEQNDEIEQANIDLTKARDVAEQNAELANDRAELALNSYQVLIDQAESALEELPGASEVRRELLLLSSEGLRMLAEEMSKSSKAEPTLGAALIKLADLLNETGDSEEALALCREAYNLLSDRETLRQGTAESQYNVALVLLRLARLTGKHERTFVDTEKFLRQSIEYFETVLQMGLDGSDVGEVGILRSLPSLVLAREELAQHYLRIGDPLNSLGENRRIIKLIEANDKYLTASDEEGSNAIRVQLLARRASKYSASGQCHERLGEWEEALQAHADAQRQLEELSDEIALSTSKRYEALITSAHGWCLLQVGELQRARELLNSAESIFSDFHRAMPENAAFQNLLGLACYRLGIALELSTDSGYIDEYARCLDLRTELLEASPENASFKKSVALIRARTGDTERALKLTEELLQDMEENDIELKVDLARVYSICSAKDADNADDLADKALDLLESGIELGYRNAALEREPDFSALQAEARFSDLKSKATPRGTRGVAETN